MSVRIARLDHVVLRSTDMERSLAFYCDVLGCKEERRVERLGLVQLRAGASMLDLVPAGADLPEKGNMDHVAFRVEPFDEFAIRAHLTSFGIDPGETVARYGAEGMGPSIYIKDPDGNTVELKGPSGG